MCCFVGVKLGCSHCGRNVGLRVCENRVLRKIYGPQGDKVTGEWRKLHNEELSDLYILPKIVQVIRSKELDGRGM